MTQHTPPTVALKTLGCKLNQFESEQIREELVRLGAICVPFDARADIYIINSCTVTAKTDRDCRRLIRRARKTNPSAFIAVTGCYAQVSPDDLAAIPEADLIVGNEAKGDLPATIRARTAGSLTWPATDVSLAVPCFDRGTMVDEFADHTRAFVKVQEGCNAACAYCIIPRARGRSRSVPLAQVLEQARRLVDAGFPEIVLIGTHLGQYGQDLPDGIDLCGLVEQLADLPDMRRLRLSSIEPLEVPDRLIRLVAHHPKVCRHLHIPIQHSDETVLRRMNRPYGPDTLLDLITRIHGADPGVNIGSDVIVGFPGETDAQFETCRRFIEDLPFGYLHVFTYSPRKNTPAATMPDQVNPQVKLARNHLLRELSERKRSAFAAGMIGQVLHVIFERPAEGREGWLDGLSDNYLRVFAPGACDLLGRTVPVRIGASRGEVLEGTICAEG
ncbi:MAG: tRNA (N(6)-L-threonylcarbamoyladenosine(37)-C(2))-methylthiotransferase MtaB [Armatimonadetes bacterium]|nr:tRNA (N(6)-L-threonylcarbamoyladenosine(37)-C(2))-methylthiotransferase MtaB [Armatimonadota bacterium]